MCCQGNSKYILRACTWLFFDYTKIASTLKSNTSLTQKEPKMNKDTKPDSEKAAEQPSQNQQHQAQQQGSGSDPATQGQAGSSQGSTPSKKRTYEDMAANSKAREEAPDSKRYY